MTLQDCAERALKKGKCAEQQEGGKLASLLCFQMGPTLDTETLYKDMRSMFLTIINDTSIGIGAREQCCYTLICEIYERFVYMLPKVHLVKV
jgi:hypothetical protein